MTDLTARQTVKVHLMSRGYRTAFIVHFYLIFCAVVFKEIFSWSHDFFMVT